MRHGWRIATNADGGRSASMRRVKFAMLPRFSRLALTDDDGLDFLVNTNDRVIGRDLYVGSSHEVGVACMAETLDVVEDAIGPDFLKGKVFIDVGANIGTTAIAALLRFDAERAIAVEPSPENVRLMRCNAILNDVEDRLTVVAAAVSDTPGEVELELWETSHGQNRVLLDGSSTAGEVPSTRITVPALRLDSLLEDNGVEPEDIGLLWVDVEGFEGHVFRSAGRFLGTVPCLTEFAPFMMEAAGGVEPFAELVASAFTTVVDVRNRRTVRSSEIGSIAEALGPRGWTDLVLVP